MQQLRGDFRRDHQTEKERLLNDTEFLDAVDRLYDVVVTSSPELQVAIDEKRGANSQQRKEWMEKHKELLKEYQKRWYNSKAKKNKCVDCGKDVLVTSLRCKKCHMKVIGESRGGKRRKEDKNTDGEKKDNVSKRQMQEAVSGVSSRDERDVPHVPIFRQEEGELK
jgi:hypothetical protein